ncbi:MAG: hypothetical protein L0216_13650 [Planctomycetales bacterium]|nr:hypothetical protein [Planctomycetales bacterium]
MGFGRPLLVALACAAAAGCADARRPAAADPGAGKSPVPPSGASGEVSASPTAVPAGELEVTSLPSLATARLLGTAVPLPGGDVLLVGGEGGATGPLDTAEVFETARVSWRGTRGRLAFARTRHAAVALADGRVLVCGGSAGGPALRTAEVYDPARDEFLPTGDMTVPRAGHSATLLPGGSGDGRVLVAGGLDDGGRVLDTVEVFDPSTGTFSPAPGRLSEPRRHHTATALASGAVLLAGGLLSGPGDPLRASATADLYDPGSGLVRRAGSLAGPRAEHTATRLASGHVLLVGGTTHLPEPGARADAEVYEPGPSWAEAGSFAPVESPLACPRTLHSATLRPDGTVLIAGGTTAPFPELLPVTVLLEVFVPDALGRAPTAPYGGLPATGLFVQPVGPAGEPVVLPGAVQGLTAHAAALLPGGAVLVAGGADAAFGRPVAVARTAACGAPGTIPAPRE